MRWFHLPFTELINRLIFLNQDRHRGYADFAEVCHHTGIRKKCEEMAKQSSQNIRELEALLDSGLKEEMQAASFTVSPQFWQALYEKYGQMDIQQIAGIIYKIEDQFSILYKLVYNMIEGDDEPSRKLIRQQYDRLLESKFRVPHLLIHYN